jgi:hypothetical protein
MTDRTITYRREIKVSPADLEGARTGKKICTIRLGIASVPNQTIDLTDGSSRLQVRITRVDNSKKFGEIGTEEARGEGFGSIAELRQDLRQYYRNLDDQQSVTVIWFVVSNQSPAF